MTAKPELQTEALAAPRESHDAIIELRKDVGGEDVLHSVASGSAHGVSTSSPPAGGDLSSTKKSARAASASPPAGENLGASRRSVAVSSHAPSEANGIYGPSTFGALDRFKDSNETPHALSDPKPLSTGRRSSFHNGGTKDERTPVQPMPNPSIPGPGSYNVRPAVEKGSVSNFRRVPSLTFNSRHDTNWVMLKNGMQIAVLTSTTVPVAPEVPEGSIRSHSASGMRQLSPRRASSPTGGFSKSARFPSSETCTPGPGAYVAVDGLNTNTTPTKTKRGPSNDGAHEGDRGASQRASSVPKKKINESPKRSRSPSPCLEPGPGPGAYHSPVLSSSILRCGSAKSTFSKAVRESNLPVARDDSNALGSSSRPQLSSWVHSSANAFIRRSQERWTQRNSQTPSQAASPRRTSLSRTSQPASPVAAPDS
jgi:hypothetical protein